MGLKKNNKILQISKYDVTAIYICVEFSFFLFVFLFFFVFCLFSVSILTRLLTKKTKQEKIM